MTPFLRPLFVGFLALGLAACGTETDTAQPLDGVENVSESTAEIPAGTYAIDASHSEIGFRARHFGISNVDGNFTDFTGTITVPETGLDGMTASLVAQTASIDTDNEQRDGHLTGEDFFFASEYPEVTFETTSVTPTGGNAFEMTGNLTMRGVTKPVTLTGEYIGAAVVGETQKIGFEASGEIVRQEWDLTWQNTNEAGELAVSDDIRLMIGVEADRQDETAADAPAEGEAAPADA
ncbi:MAG: YceI family protein [Bacteroidota bacterium]